MSEPASRPGGDGTVPVHAEPIGAFIERAGVTGTRGLDDEEVARRLAAHGANRLPEATRKSAVVRLLEQISNPLVLTLLAAAGVAIVVGATDDGAAHGWLSRYGDACAILLIVVLNAFLGFYQERRAEAALDALQRLSTPSARARRGGKLVVIPAAQLVPGDVLEFEAGDAVAADARLVQTIDLAVEEAALTGESVPVGKDALAPVASDAPLGDRVTMVYSGTIVVRGKARAVVTATGVATELGRIGEMLGKAKPSRTPLEERLDRFGKAVLAVCLTLSTVLLAWGFFRGGRSWAVILLEAVSLAVAAIPEGLPAITTITLALGMLRMAKRGAIVRKLSAVETLGAATVIASDKTGTLTQNEMTVRALWADGHRYGVSGAGYDPEGHLEDDHGAELTELPAPLAYTLSTAMLCNNAHLVRDDAERRWKVVGDPTEGALLTLAAKAGLSRESIAPQHELVTELPFDSDRKRMAVVTRDARGREVVHVKGSVDVLLPRCRKIAASDGPRALCDADRMEVQRETDRMSRNALRVLAICRRLRKPSESDDADLETELTFLGLVGMMDPPRPAAARAVAECKKAGIRAVMITGDHKLTATAIAREIGLWEEGDDAVSGGELAAMSDVQLAERIEHLRVFARTTAEQKLRIVQAFKAHGHVVAMTGDGVNDAPALREAHIGIAMGKSGTDVARQAADMVLADDDFATIVEAVREGRAIYRNIQKFIFFLLSANMGLVVAVLVVSFFGRWPPLAPLAILWINLVTNGLPALALGIDPPDAHLMLEKPRRVGDGLLLPRDYIGILCVGILMGAAAVSIYAMSAPTDAALAEARALAFSVLALSPLFHAWSCRSPTRSVIAARPLVSKPLLFAFATSAAIHLVAVIVPGLRPVFKTYPVTAEQWLLVLGLSAAIVPAVEIAKAIYRAAGSPGAPPGSVRPGPMSVRPGETS